MQRGVEALAGELLADPLHGHPGGLEVLGDLLVAPGVGAVGVGLEQDAGADEQAAGMGARGEVPPEGVPLVIGQVDGDLVLGRHAGTPGVQE